MASSVAFVIYDSDIKFPFWNQFIYVKMSVYFIL